ncbi:hypothetical protein S40288_04635 [Stachybotrys chartarum IBT 40288]|nr:hypothetical protein S40288_04635 [Stachybotrys chartarum IBT 40288]
MLQKGAFAVALMFTATSLGQDILLPSAPGPYDVTLRTTELNDFSREELYAPNANHRRIMVSIFLPVPKGSESCESTYMPEAVANYEAQFYASVPPPYNLSLDIRPFQQQTCSVDVTHGDPDESTDQQAGRNATSFPLIFFSPGHGGLRFWCHLMMQHFGLSTYLCDLWRSNTDNLFEFPAGVAYSCMRPACGRCQSEVFYSSGMHPAYEGFHSEALCIREVAMMKMMEMATDKENWHIDVFNDSDINPKTDDLSHLAPRKLKRILDDDCVEYCIRELREKAKPPQKDRPDSDS